MADNEWVVYDCEAKALHCQRCGDRYPVIFPVDVGMFVAMTKAFIDRHQHCRKPAPQAIDVAVVWCPE